MNLALSDEQELLREAARGTLARLGTVAAARAALDGRRAPNLWPAAVEAGWPGLLISEEHGGAGLSAFDAMLVAQECGRVLAGVPLLGHLPATALLDAAGDERLEALAAGELRAAWLPARPPGDADPEPGWTVERRRGAGREPAPRARTAGDRLAFTGTVAWVPDAPGADCLVVVGTGPDGAPVAGAVDAADARVEAVVRYDATRALGHVVLDDAPAERLDVRPEALARAWYLAQALLAAEAVGAVEATLEMAVGYAKERFTFGRAIGSYQAIKHGLTEVLRLLENARSLLYYAGWAFADRPEEFPLAASAARSAAGRALDHAARQNITTHGGIGATWEHDAPLYFRRAQLTRRLLGGNADATDRVAGELLAAVDGAQRVA
ncbi:MAG TPA: acyl-CoA dehydrogenase family protein [Solirubrobacteraceae bacterium]|nr:acyl-CoA dehydrogenase family protein [Solirubrobacteraceae bacterium]